MKTTNAFLDVTFASGHETCAGAWYLSHDRSLETSEGRPCVVMAHGFGATRKSGLDGFAEKLSDAGFDVLAFDYRGFGQSSGEPRGLIDPDAQAADWAAALTYARKLNGVDPSRIAVWGVSFSGGQVLRVAARDGELAAVVSVTPMVDGLVALRTSARFSPGVLAAVTMMGIRDLIASFLNRPPVTVPITGLPGSVAILTAPGVHEDYAAVAGPDWHNSTPARVALKVGSYRPCKAAKRINCPVLIQIATADLSASPEAARSAAESARADVRNYPCDHFDIYPGRKSFEPVVEHQIEFLRFHLGPPVDPR